MKYIFTKYAAKQWEKLNGRTRDRVTKKLMLLKDDALAVSHLTPLLSLPPATHRLRVGDYRLLLLCDFSRRETFVLKIAHRREVYRT